MADRDDQRAAKIILLRHALERLCAGTIPMARASLFVVPEDVEAGTDLYEILATLKLVPVWQRRALECLCAHGLLRREQTSASVVYAKTAATEKLLGGEFAKTEIAATIYWAVFGAGPPPVPRVFMMTEGEGRDEAPRKMHPKAIEDEVDEVGDDESFEMLVAQNLKAMGTRLRKLEERVVQAQQTLDNMQSTTRNLNEALGRFVERNASEELLLVKLVEVVTRIEQSASTIERAASSAERDGLYAAASRFRALTEESRALQELLLESLSIEEARR